MNYDNKVFKPVSLSENAELSADTKFIYKQEGNVLISEYSGGEILKGHLLGLVDAAGNIDMRYHQINTKGELMTGRCISKPKILTNGKIRLYETWQWTSGDLSKGTSILEEV